MTNNPYRLTFHTKNAQREKTVVILMYIFTFLLLLSGLFFPRKPGGGDSSNYIIFAQGGLDLFLNNEIDQYRFTRTFPSLLVGYALRLFNFTLTTENIKNGFNILNAIAIFIALYYWLKICDIFKFNIKSKIIGYTGMIINFPILKFSMFNPILTDTMAFMLGTMLLYFFFESKRSKLLLVTIIGAFTFPPIIAEGLILYIFPFEKNNRVLFKFKDLIFPILSVLIYLFILCFFFFILPDEKFQKVIHRIPSGINYVLLVISILAICSYIYHTFSKLLSLEYFMAYFKKYFHNKMFWFRLLVAIIIILGVKVLTFRFASPDIGVNPIGFLSTVLISPLQNPFLFLLSHILYYGPILFLVIFYWKNVSDFCNFNGIALNLILIFCIFLSFQSESRMLICFLPLIILAITNYLNSIEIKKYSLIFFVLLSLCFSRIWFNIWGPNMQGDYLEFPMQRYFMIQGPWMSDLSYYLQSLIVIICIIPFYIFVKKEQLNIEK